MGKARPTTWRAFRRPGGEYELLVKLYYQLLNAHPPFATGLYRLYADTRRLPWGAPTVSCLATDFARSWHLPQQDGPEDVANTLLIARTGETSERKMLLGDVPGERILREQWTLAAPLSLEWWPRWRGVPVVSREIVPPRLEPQRYTFEAAPDAAAAIRRWRDEQVAAFDAAMDAQIEKVEQEALDAGLRDVPVRYRDADRKDATIAVKRLFGYIHEGRTWTQIAEADSCDESSVRGGVIKVARKIDVAVPVKRGRPRGARSIKH